MLFDPARHEPLQDLAWDEARVRATIVRIVRDAEARFDSKGWWPLHPRDGDGPAPESSLYVGAVGVIWALHYLDRVGAAPARRSFAGELESLRQAIGTELVADGRDERASYLFGETSVLMLRYAIDPRAADLDRLAELIAGNVDHPARELMWGSPGTLLAAWFLFGRTGDARFAELFRRTARRLWSQLHESAEHRCRYWTQDLYGRTSTYIDAVHGFVGTATPLILGRALFSTDEWSAWERCIVETVAATATRDGRFANWRPLLDPPAGWDKPLLMQYCHGAPGFIVCVAGLPGTELDELLVAGGEATWASGPLTKGANLCHGTGGNGYAFLKLFARTGDRMWLERARAFAMHAIAQSEADAARVGRLRYSLWTGDLGFAIYLWDCLRGIGTFPTVDAFYTA